MQACGEGLVREQILSPFFFFSHPGAFQINKSKWIDLNKITTRGDSLPDLEAQ